MTRRNPSPAKAETPAERGQLVVKALQGARVAIGTAFNAAIRCTERDYDPVIDLVLRANTLIEKAQSALGIDPNPGDLDK